MSYSDEEITTAIEKLLRSKVRRSLDSLGSREVEITFSDFQEAAAGVFLTQPAAPQYLVYLGSRRLLEEIRIVRESLTLLDTLCTLATRRVLTDADTTGLKSAASALLSLESAVSSRSSAFRDITKTPEFTRFGAETGRFLSGPASVVRSAGQIVRSPQEARSLLSSTLKVLKTKYDALGVKAQALSLAPADYEALSLPAVVARSVIQKARRSLDARVSELDGLTEDQLSQKMRAVALDVMAARAVLKRVGTFSGPTSWYPASGTGQFFTDSAHPTTGALLNADIVGPYVLKSGSSTDLALTVDGAPLAMSLFPSQGAEVEGAVVEPFEVPALCDLQVRYKTSFLALPVGVGAGVSAVQVVADLNAGLVAFGHGSNLQAYTIGAAGAQRVGLRVINPNQWEDKDFLEVGGDPSVSTLAGVIGLAYGQRAYAKKSHTGVVVTDINSRTDRIAAAEVRTTSSFYYLTTDPNGPSSVVNSRGTVTVTKVGPRALLFTLAGHAALIGDRVSILSGVLAGSTWTVTATTSAQITMVSDTTNAVSATLVQLQVSRPRVPEGMRLDFELFRGVVTTSSPAPNTIKCINALWPDLVPGESIFVRTGADAGTLWTITAVTATEITAVGTVTPVGGSAEIAIGMAFGSVEGHLLTIAEGPNKGDFRVKGRGVVPFELELETPLFTWFDGPLLKPLEIYCQSGPTVVQWKSTSTGITSVLSITNGPGHTAAAQFFSALPASSSVKSKYFLLPVGVTEVAVDDELALFATEGTVADVSPVVEEIEVIGARRLLTLDSEVNLSLGVVWDFSAALPPFARLLNRQTWDWRVFCSSITTGSIGATYFTEINRLLNPLIINRNPTESSANAVKAKLLELGAELTALESVCEGFSHSAMPDVDGLLKALIEKGSRRAVDQLLQGQFTGFFGMDIDDASYAGTMMKATRNMAREDLPVRKTDRQDQVHQTLISSSEDTDYEYSSADIERELPLAMAEEVEYPR